MGLNCDAKSGKGWVVTYIRAQVEKRSKNNAAVTMRQALRILAGAQRSTHLEHQPEHLRFLVVDMGKSFHVAQRPTIFGALSQNRRFQKLANLYDEKLRAENTNLQQSGWTWICGIASIELLTSLVGLEIGYITSYETELSFYIEHLPSSINYCAV